MIEFKQPHIFAGNPLDRGEVERRDENWINEKAKDPTSRFLPMRGPGVLVTADGADRGKLPMALKKHPAWAGWTGRNWNLT